MYTEAKPFIEPDMSNMHRLTAEKMRRDRLKAAHPKLQQGIETALQSPLAEEFTKQIQGNDAAELRVFIARIFEAAVAQDDTINGNAMTVNQIAEDMRKYTRTIGADARKVNQVIESIRDHARTFILG